MADAIVRGGWHEGGVMSDHIYLRGMDFEGRIGVGEGERADPQDDRDRRRAVGSTCAGRPQR